MIGAVNGYALGGGLELALSTDFLIASEAAKFGQPEVGLGVIPGFGGTFLLARQIGPARAKELIFTGKRIDAEEAKDIGIVNHTVEKEELMNEAQEIAQNIADNSPVALDHAKRAIEHGTDHSKKEALLQESANFKECFESEDQKEGMEAFLEKREPDF
ncbi:MAG: enoyl-CoA hydratase/isomerase family protein [Candidatus Natronoplasma sp.]